MAQVQFLTKLLGIQVRAICIDGTTCLPYIHPWTENHFIERQTPCSHRVQTFRVSILLPVSFLLLMLVRKLMLAIRIPWCSLCSAQTPIGQGTEEYAFMLSTPLKICISHTYVIYLLHTLPRNAPLSVSLHHVYINTSCDFDILEGCSLKRTFYLLTFMKRGFHETDEGLVLAARVYRFMGSICSPTCCHTIHCMHPFHDHRDDHVSAAHIYMPLKVLCFISSIDRPTVTCEPV